jgi:adenosylcobyric acid synthase
MHMGETTGPDTARPFALLDGIGPEGAISRDGSVMGSYLHGLLAAPEARGTLLARIGVAGSGRDHAADVDAALDQIAAELECHVDVDGLLQLARGTS